MENTEIVPAPGAQPPAVPADQPPPVPPIVDKNPLVQAVYLGILPAVSAPDVEGVTVLDEISKQHQQIADAGLDFYLTLDKSRVVLFNPEQISGDQVREADAAGQLATVAPDYQAVLTALGKKDLLEDAPAKQANMGASASPVNATPAQTPMPSPSATNDTLSTARKNNLTQRSPTSGSRPGAGQIVNKIINRAV